jgi:hypothetical protein
MSLWLVKSIFALNAAVMVGPMKEVPTQLREKCFVADATY